MAGIKLGWHPHPHVAMPMWRQCGRWGVGVGGRRGMGGGVAGLSWLGRLLVHLKSPVLFSSLLVSSRSFISPCFGTNLHSDYFPGAVFFSFSFLRLQSFGWDFFFLVCLACLSCMSVLHVCLSYLSCLSVCLPCLSVCLVCLSASLAYLSCMSDRVCLSVCLH